MDKKPIIAITPLFDEERNSIWMIPGYHDMLLQCGALPIDLPFGMSQQDANQLMELCSGLVLTGGQDISPEAYGQNAIRECGATLAARDEIDRLLLDTAIAHDLPVLGICRGLQMINAYFGGSLFQDLPTQHPSSVEHCMKPPYDRIQHQVRILEQTPLAEIAGPEDWGVNSYHHQAICQLAPCLEPMAVSEDGIIEALRHPQMEYLWAVQWHPELSFRKDKRQVKLLESFVEAARARSKKRGQSTD